jgi:hypothetical protein
LVAITPIQNKGGTIKTLKKLNDHYLYKNQDGDNYEYHVAGYFEKNGWNVACSESESQNGYDLVCIKDNKYITVEVKKAFFSCRSWRVTPVSRKSRNSRYIAIVLPDGFIHIESMKDHMALCSKNGNRCVTDICNLRSS